MSKNLRYAFLNQRSEIWTDPAVRGKRFYSNIFIHLQFDGRAKMHLIPLLTIMNWKLKQMSDVHIKVLSIINLDYPSEIAKRKALNFYASLGWRGSVLFLMRLHLDPFDHQTCWKRLSRTLVIKASAFLHSTRLYAFHTVSCRPCLVSYRVETQVITLAFVGAWSEPLSTFVSSGILKSESKRELRKAFNRQHWVLKTIHVI